MALFPDLEGIIPENGGIIRAKSLFLRRNREVIFSPVPGAEKRVKRVFVHIMQSGRDRRGAVAVLEGIDGTGVNHRRRTRSG